MPLTPEQIEDRLKALEDRNAKLEELLRTGRAFTDNPLSLATDLDDLGSVKTHLDFEEPPLTPVNPQADVARVYAADDDGTTRLYHKDSDGLRTELGGFTLLEQITLTGTAQTLASFTSIPAKFRNLHLVWSGTSAAGSAVRNVVVRFNGDAGSNYHFQSSLDAVSEQGLGAAFIRVSRLDGTVTGRECWGNMDIFNYVQFAIARGATFKGGNIETGEIKNREGVGQWNNTAAAIDRVDILSDGSTAKFASGSTAMLYGY